MNENDFFLEKENMFKVGVVGSRRRNAAEDKAKLKYVLEGVIKKLPYFENICLISGGCPEGADKFAEELADELKLRKFIHQPDYSALPPNPKRFHFTTIYFARNRLIAKDCDVLLALPAPDRKGGTENTIKHAILFGKKVVLI